MQILTNINWYGDMSMQGLKLWTALMWSQHADSMNALKKSLHTLGREALEININFGTLIKWRI